MSRNKALRTKRAVELVEDGVRIDGTLLEDPRETYEADYAYIQNRNGGVSLFFAKGSPATSPAGLRSRLEVRVAYEDFIAHFWEPSRQFDEELRKRFVDTSFAEVDRVDADPATMAAEKEHSVRATIVRLTRAGSSGSIDCYHIAPTDLHNFRTTRDPAHVRVTPIVRVYTSLNEMLSLLRDGESVAEIARKAIAQLKEALERASEQTEVTHR